MPFRGLCMCVWHFVSCYCEFWPLAVSFLQLVYDATLIVFMNDNLSHVYRFVVRGLQMNMGVLNKGKSTPYTSRPYVMLLFL